MKLKIITLLSLNIIAISQAADLQNIPEINDNQLVTIIQRLKNKNYQGDPNEVFQHNGTHYNILRVVLTSELLNQAEKRDIIEYLVEILGADPYLGNLHNGQTTMDYLEYMRNQGNQELREIENYLLGLFPAEMDID